MPSARQERAKNKEEGEKESGRKLPGGGIFAVPGQVVKQTDKLPTRMNKEAKSGVRGGGGGQWVKLVFKERFGDTRRGIKCQIALPRLPRTENFFFNYAGDLSKNWLGSDGESLVGEICLLFK